MKCRHLRGYSARSRVALLFCSGSLWQDGKRVKSYKDAITPLEFDLKGLWFRPGDNDWFRVLAFRRFGSQVVRSVTGFTGSAARVEPDAQSLVSSHKTCLFDDAAG